MHHEVNPAIYRIFPSHKLMLECPIDVYYAPFIKFLNKLFAYQFFFFLTFVVLSVESLTKVPCLRTEFSFCDLFLVQALS